jgi:hypothetical protein
MSLGDSWGVTESERGEPFPCDGLCPSPCAALFRGVMVAAPASILFGWLCQLRVAPYSYDWLDNGGRRSPRTLTPGLVELRTGQRVMSIFDLVAFEPDRSITIVNRARGGARRVFGEVWVSYVIAPGEGRGCRLLAKLLVRYPGGITGGLLRRVLPLGDLLMMRRQLLNLKELAERDATGAAQPPG